MITNFDLKKHFRPKSGWMNDPNGLVYYKGEYHAFYQYSPNFERPWQEPMHWGHAVTRDFITWEELPVALYPDKSYDDNGCWSGTAIVKDGVLYIIYSSVRTEKKIQTVSVAYSTDGRTFTKYENNPVILDYPDVGSEEFRDPALLKYGDKYFCVMASGDEKEEIPRLLLYESYDLLSWEYKGVLAEFDGGKICECPSFLHAGEKYLLATSVAHPAKKPFFSIMYGDFDGRKFNPILKEELICGPDQYAGQIFTDDKGRNILISWVPGWSYYKFAEKSLGCLSTPLEISVDNGKLRAYPVQEVRHLLKDSDPAIKLTEKGFSVERTERDSFSYEGEIWDFKVIKDEYILEVFINKGEKVFTFVLC